MGVYVTDFGSAVVELVDGRPRVVSADDRIGISPELLAGADPAHMPVVDGLLWLAGDPAFRYRPVAFAEYCVLVCERVR